MTTNMKNDIEANIHMPLVRRMKEEIDRLQAALAYERERCARIAFDLEVEQYGSSSIGCAIQSQK